MGDLRDDADEAQPNVEGTELLPGGITPEQPPMDDAAGGPQAEDADRN